MGRQERVRGCLVWGVLGPLLATVVFYWGWCWGWWGSENLFLIWLLQCQCPRASEEARYPERVDVIVSACWDPTGGSISPSGRYMLIGEHQPQWAMYLMDLQTGTQQPADLPGGAFFLTDNKVLISQEGGGYVLVELTDNSRLPLNRVENLPGAIGPDGTLTPEALAPFRKAKWVLVRGGIAVALLADYEHHPDKNFTLGSTAKAAQETEQVLNDNGIAFQRTREACGALGCVSRNELLVYRGDIFAVENNHQVVDSYGTEKRPFTGGTWVYDDSGVVLFPLGTYLIGERNQMFAYFPVPQPVLKLKVPVEYLSSEARAREEARQAQEQAAKQQAAVAFWIIAGVVTGIAVVGAGLVVFRQRKKNEEIKSNQG